MNVMGVKREVTEFKTQVADIKRKLAEQEKRLADQDRVIVDQNRKLTEQDKLVSDMNRKLIDYDQKFDDVLAELAKVRTPPGGSNANQMVHLQGTDSNGNPIVVEMQMKKGPEDNGSECSRKTRSMNRAEVPIQEIQATTTSVKKRKGSSEKCNRKGGPSKRTRTN